MQQGSAMLPLVIPKGWVGPRTPPNVYDDVDDTIVLTPIHPGHPNAPSRGGPYGHFDDPPTANSGKDFAPSQKRKFWPKTQSEMVVFCVMIELEKFSCIHNNAKKAFRRPPTKRKSIMFIQNHKVGQIHIATLR